MKKYKWQHIRPQRDLDHEVKPVTIRNQVCATCGRDIIRVEDNEGPESLKALFRF